MRVKVAQTFRSAKMLSRSKDLRYIFSAANPTNKKGFSLVELLTTLGLMFLLLGTISSAFISQVRFCSNIAGECETEQIKNFVLEKIKQDIRAAQAILPESDKAHLVLQLEKDKIEYSIINHKVRRRINSYTQYLTDTNQIKNLFFYYPTENGVRVELENFVCDNYLRN